MSSSIKINLAANLTGRAWTALMGLAFVPVYIEYMGMESFGLVGFFTTLIGISMILDMGLTTTLNRELARLSAAADSAAEMRTLVHTLEAVYWVIAFVVGALIFAGARFIAENWLNADALPPETVSHAIMLMGLTLAFQLPMGFYGGGLLGLQKQVRYNIIYAGVATIRFGGAALVLMLVSPSIIAFFLWQTAIVLLGVIAARFTLMRTLPAAAGYRLFSAQKLKDISGFTFGTAGIMVTAVILTQSDKLILSRMLSLTDFGYYSLAWLVASALFFITQPVFTAFFPRFSSVSVSDASLLPSLYRKASRFMAIAVIPLAITLAFFSKEILGLWVQDPLTVENTWLLVSLLVIGVAANGMINIPYALQLSQGWLRLTFITNIFAIIFLIPGLIFASMQWGATGAAVVWLILNCGYILVIPPLMHRRLLPGEKRNWYIHALLVPVITSVAVCACFKMIYLWLGGYAVISAGLAMVTSCTLLTLWLPEIRTVSLQLLQKVLNGNRELHAKG